MVPDLRIEKHRRIRELVHSRVVLVTVAVVLALAPLPVCGQEVKSVGGDHHRGCSLPVCGRVKIGRGLLTVTALAGTALGVTCRVLWTVTDHVDSVRIPELAGEVAVTVRSHTIS